MELFASEASKVPEHVAQFIHVENIIERRHQSGERVELTLTASGIPGLAVCSAARGRRRLPWHSHIRQQRRDILSRCWLQWYWSCQSQASCPASRKSSWFEQTCLTSPLRMGSDYPSPTIAAQTTNHWLQHFGEHSGPTSRHFESPHKILSILCKNTSEKTNWKCMPPSIQSLTLPSRSELPMAKNFLHSLAI